jgi:dienelactone hydrolase
MVEGVLVGFALVVGCVLVYLVVIIFLPVLRVAPQPIQTAADRGESVPEAPPCREHVMFPSGRETVHGRLYLSVGTSGALPCVVMSQGFGGTMDCLVERYALRFVNAGFAALTYDFRHFGLSGGEPRQLYEFTRQVEDLRAAVAYVRSREEVDRDQVFLWGTSASGGYGLVVAAEDEAIRGLIAQCPGIDHKKDSKLYLRRVGLGFFLKLVVHAQRDKGRSRFGLSPHTFPIVGRPGTISMLNAPGAFEGFSTLVGESHTFRNEVCARLLLMAHGQDPVESAQNVRCPVLFLVCEHDSLAAPDSYERAAEALGDRAEVRSYPIGHFDIYTGDHLERAVSEMIDFLRRHAGSSVPEPADPSVVS